MLVEKLKTILSGVNPEINTETITEETKLVGDLGLDSLNMMLLAVQVEDEFGFRFDDMPTFETVGDLCRYIDNKTSGSAGAR
ncbi:MAG: phosphopantetheine-binding protein [Clostridiales bacterium]|nr:phosphopantetheine-binding protein [Clostridiales bacterium]